MYEEGERQLHFCAINYFAIMSTLYRQKKNKLRTWISLDEKAKNQID